uniref:Uncharacterized protein n=1 Tax=Anguilla anguilla TaxID=7936 RepID=A0A0E9S0U1_ANGAN
MKFARLDRAGSRTSRSRQLRESNQTRD